MLRQNHRGVAVVVPEGEQVDELLARVDETGTGRKLLQALDGRSRAAMRKLFATLYATGLREGVDRAIELRDPDVDGEVGELIAGEPEPTPAALLDLRTVNARGVRSPIQAVIERYRRADLTLPAPPEAAIRLNQLLSDPDHDLGALVDHVRKDPGLTARVMALAASPFYARGSKPPRSLADAFIRIGSQDITRYLLTFTNRRLFNFRSRRRESALHGLWEHSLASALMAEMIAAEVEGGHPPTWFLHALLHDVGRAVLLQIVDEMEANRELDESYGDEAIDRMIDGLHGQFGAALLQKWNFAESFAEVARFHHQPRKSFAFMKLVAGVALADVLACRSGFGEEREIRAESPLEDHPAVSFLRIDPHRLEALAAQLPARLDRLTEAV